MEQPSETNSASYALTAYHHQPVALQDVPPSSDGGAFLPAPAPQQIAAAYTAAVPPPPSNPHLAAFQQLQQVQQQQHRHQQEQLQAFWVAQLAEAEQAVDLKVHSLPLARIKKIMKADEDVNMIATEAPVMFAKACEMFVLELTLRAWLHAEAGKRRTLQRSDVAAAICRTETLDFLMDLLTEEELRADGGGAVGVQPPLGMVPSPSSSSSSYVPGPATPIPFSFANQQPVTFMWPLPEHQQQQSSDGGRDE